MSEQRRPVPKPVPTPSPETSFYWEKCSQHELWLRKCQGCGRAYFYPRDICPKCFSRNTTWIQSSGRGLLYTFAVVVRPFHPAWAEEVPYVVAMVDLEEGCRIPTNLVQVQVDPNNPGETIRIGMPVELVWEDRTDQVSLPVFKLV